MRPGLEHVDPGQLIALAAAVGFAISMILVKSLTATESVVSIIFWMLVVQSVIGIVPAALVWRTPTAQVWPWIVRDRAVRHLLALLHGAGAAPRRRDDDRADGLPARAARPPSPAGSSTTSASICSRSSAPALILVANLLNLRRSTAAPEGRSHGDLAMSRRAAGKSTAGARSAEAFEWSAIPFTDTPPTPGKRRAGAGCRPTGTWRYHALLLALGILVLGPLGGRRPRRT